MVRAVLSLFLLVTKRLYGKEREWSIGQIKTCRKKQHVKIDGKKEMSELICGKAAVGGNYNSTRDSKHGETFGANIYKLFDDAFFLGKKGQIGEFARKKIQAIIDKIKPDISNMEEVIYPTLTEEEVCLLEQQIALIGEKIIRDKLYEMLYKCKYNSLDLRQKKIKIYEEKIKRLQNEEDI